MGVRSNSSRTTWVLDKITHLNAMRIFRFDRQRASARWSAPSAALRELAKGRDISFVPGRGSTTSV